MATRIIESVDQNPAPLRMMLGSAAVQNTIDVLTKRLDDYKKQKDLAASTDFPDGE
ncbi:hypothetical protein [Pediococcus parvulus]|nr:hypothetical protein [Pediococcus parvulus]